MISFYLLHINNTKTLEFILPVIDANMTERCLLNLQLTIQESKTKTQQITCIKLIKKYIILIKNFSFPS